MLDRTEYKCEHCNKLYSSYKSRWLHIKKYHVVNVVKNDINVVKTVVKDVVKKTTECTFCNKVLSDRISKWRHEKHCKQNNKQKLCTDELKKENQEMKKEIEELKKFKNEIMKSMKIHPKTLQKINNQLNNSGIINNNNIVIQVGNEDFNNVLSEKEKLFLLNKYANSVVEMVKMVHISDKDKFKQYKSMYITNLQNNVAYKYDEGSKKFIAVTKSELLESIIDNRLADIETFHEDYKEKITPFTSKQITKFIERMTDEKEYKDIKKEEIKFAIYNGREEIINQIKEYNPDLNLFIN